ncbi:MAG: MMPL family transporter [Candidatus Sericytochromatia bacterium]|nr:MMPL family transporter [Candidatus Sericytochromatia bacterium]
MTLAWWAFALLLAIAASGRWADRLVGGIGTVPGSASASVEAKVASDFDMPFAQALVVIVRSRGDARAGQAFARDLQVHLAEVPAIRRTVVWPTRPPDPEVLVLGLAAPSLADAERAVPGVRAAIGAWAAQHPQAVVTTTGQAAYNVDLSLRANEESARGEQRVLPLTLLALLWIFGGLTAALAPLVAGVVAVLSTVGAVCAIGAATPLSVYATSIASMLGLGLGIDYALLLVSRWREQRRLGAEPAEALREAIAATVPAIVVSATTVAVALVALLWVPVLDTRGLGLGGTLVALASLMAAITVLPALASLLGRQLDRASWLPDVRDEAARVAWWEARTRTVVAHPWPTLALAVALLLALAWPARDLHFAFPEIHQMPAQLEAVQGWHQLERLGSSGEVMPLRVLIEADGPVLEAGRLAGLLQAAAWLQQQPWVRVVRGPVAPGNAAPWLTASRKLGPERLRRTLPEPFRWYVSRDGRQALLELVPPPGTSVEAAKAHVVALRTQDWGRFAGLAGCRVHVGGAAALTLDIQQAVVVWAPIVAATMFGLTFFMLFRLTHSWLIPLKAIVANVLTVAAALGLTISICQTPWTAHAIGLTSPLVGVMPGLVLLLLAVVFGLSMDYEIFLLHRILEAHRAGLSDRDAVVRGLGRSAGIISGGATLMVLVFSGFALTELPLVKVLGLALALGVLLDATIVRLALVPAAMVIAGRYNWLPGPRRPEAARAWLREAPVSENDGNAT